MNEIYIVSNSGKRNKVEKIPNIDIIFYGKNSLLEFGENLNVNKMKILVGENAFIKFGNRLRVRFDVTIDAKAKNTKIIFGNNVNLGKGNIFAGDDDNLEVVVGDNFLTALNFVLRNSDGHTIYSLEDKTKPINAAKFGIHIGRNVWLGYNVIVTKDVIIPDNVVVGVGSVVTKASFESNSIIAGVPAKTVKTNIGWDRKTITKFLAEI